MPARADPAKRRATWRAQGLELVSARRIFSRPDAFLSGACSLKESVSYPQMSDSSNYNEYGYDLINI
jgi:hypothetical protein